IFQPGLAPRAAPAGLFALFQDCQYRRFWVATLVHDIASWTLFAAQSWLVVELTHSPQMVALFFVLRLGPRVLVSLPAGALSDRYGPLRMLRLLPLPGAPPPALICPPAVPRRAHGGGVLAAAVLASVVFPLAPPAP